MALRIPLLILALLVSSQLVGASVGPTGGPAGNVTFVVKHDDHPTETSWKLTRGSRTIARQRAKSVSAPNKLVSKTFNLSPGLYRFRIWDSAGDGLCCASGQGYWKIYNEDLGPSAEIYSSEGDFDRKEEIFFRLY
jgi:lysyl endopeptidase